MCVKCSKTELSFICSKTCNVSCCQSCTFCLKCERAVTKERQKSLIKSENRNKFCEKCFFCRSLCFCPHCSKCPQCCKCSDGGRTSAEILAEMVPPGCKSESSVHLEGRLHSSVQKQNLQKSELEPKQIFEFVGYQYDLSHRLVKPTQSRWESILQKVQSIMASPECRVRNFISLIGLLTATEKQVPLGRLHMRPIQSVAPQKTLEGPRIAGKGDSSSKVPSPAPSMVDQGDKCLTRPAPAPFASCHSNLYRRLKRRLGCSLRRLHSKWHLVSSGKSPTYKLPGTKICPTGLKRFQHLVQGKVVLVARQHHGCGIHQQGGRYEVRLTLCPSMETPVLGQSETGCAKGQAHPWSSKCDCRQVVSAGPNHSDRMVPSSGGFRPPGSELAPSPSGHVCNEVQLQTSPICVSSAGPQCVGSGCPNSLLGEPGHVCLSSSVVTGQGGQQTIGPSLQESDPNSSGLAQHALVLGSGGTIVPDPFLPTHSSRPSDTTIQQGALQGSDQPKPSRLAPRAEAIKEQGFSSPVASRIEAPQRSSTRTVYEAKWSVFVTWCETSQVDFRSPSVKQIADFLLHLFQEKNLQPSTIDGYRSAIADKLGNSSLNVSKDENLTRLLDSFHRDRPKGRRGIPSWNLSLVLHQLTKPPFEPHRKASLKHLTFKTVFLLALGSGKRRSEIHAWLNKNIRHQADWTKVSLFPFSKFSG